MTDTDSTNSFDGSAVINAQYHIGQTVYLRTDDEQAERIVVGLVLQPKDLLYILGCGTEESTHYDFEITDEVSYEV